MEEGEGYTPDALYTPILLSGQWTKGICPKCDWESLARFDVLC